MVFRVVAVCYLSLAMSIGLALTVILIRVCRSAGLHDYLGTWWIVAMSLVPVVVAVPVAVMSNRLIKPRFRHFLLERGYAEPG